MGKTSRLQKQLKLRLIHNKTQIFTINRHHRRLIFADRKQRRITAKSFPMIRVKVIDNPLLQQMKRIVRLQQ